MQKRHKYIILILISGLSLGLVIYFLTNHLAHSKLTTFLNDKDTSPIQSYENLKINVWKGQLYASDIKINWPNTKVGNTTTIKTKSIQIKGDRKSTRLNSSHVAISYAV